MGKQTFLNKIREFIGGVAFKIFLWANQTSADEYFDMILRTQIDDEYP